MISPAKIQKKKQKPCCHFSTITYFFTSKQIKKSKKGYAYECFFVLSQDESCQLEMSRKYHRSRNTTNKENEQKQCKTV